MNQETKKIASADVSKNDFVAYWEGCSRPTRYTNDIKGIEQFIKEMKPDGSELVVVECTGWYEKLLCDVLWRREVALAKVNPGRVRHFCKAKGYLAKTDPIDAKAIYEFGKAMELSPLAPPSPEREVLKQLVQRRAQLQRMHVTEQNHLKAPCIDKAAAESIKKIIGYIKAEIKAVEQKIKAAQLAVPDARALIKALIQEKGVGPVLVPVIVALLPEIGTLSRSTIAALVGVAPYNQDSGTASAQRHIRGGRADVRSVLYMATLTAIRSNPTIRDYYSGLVKRGKKKKISIVAAMRKFIIHLNSVARKALMQDSQNSWQGA